VLLLGLLLATVLAVGGVDYLSSQLLTEEQTQQFLSATSLAVSSDVEAAFAPSVNALRQLQVQAEFDRLPLDDRLRLALVLADRLRYETAIDRLLWGDQAVGGDSVAYRDGEGRIIAGRMDPALDGGRHIWWLASKDALLTRLPAELAPFDVRERTWYRPAAGSIDIVWTGPEQSADGLPVINASIAVREPSTQALLGVLGAQVFLDRLPVTLRRAVRDRPGLQALLLTREGQLLATAHPPAPEQLAAMQAALPAAVASLPLHTPIPFTFHFGGVDYAGALHGIRLASGLEWFTGFFVPRATLLEAVYERQRVALLAAAVFLLVGVSLGAFVAFRIARPLTQIASDLAQVALFRLSPAAAPRSFVSEVAVVADAVDRMKASLRSFGRYVPTDLVREMLARGEEARLGGAPRCLTIHFSDIENFTQISERLTPAELVDDLAAYLDGMSDTIRDYQGTIDKFIGDGIMAFWNAPNDVPDHAAQACRAALRAQERLQALRQQWAAVGKPQFKARIGLHTGEVIVGNFGTPDRFAYTAMGDPVNLASRLEGLNKAYGTYVMASAAVREAAGPGFEWRRLDRVAVVGRSEGTDVYELLGDTGVVPEELLRARDRYEQALAAYFARRFDEAAAGFWAVAEARPGDKAAEMMARRAEQLASYQPPPEWDGVYVSSSK
jgi:adenylate cyclase